MGPMSAKQKLILIVLSIFLLMVICVCGVSSFTGYHVADGQVVGMEYTPGAVSNGVANVAGQPTTITTITQEKYTLIISVNGAVSSYTVKPETYARAQSGQTVFSMQCNSISCVVIE